MARAIALKEPEKPHRWTAATLACVVALCACGSPSPSQGDAGVADARVPGILIGYHNPRIKDIDSSGRVALSVDGEGGVVVVFSEDWRAEKNYVATTGADAFDKELYRQRLVDLSPQIVAHRISRGGEKLWGERGVQLSDPVEGGVDPELAYSPGHGWLLLWVNKFAPGRIHIVSEVPGRATLYRTLRPDSTLGKLHRMDLAPRCDPGAGVGGQYLIACPFEDTLTRLDKAGDVAWSRALNNGAAPLRTNRRGGALWISQPWEGIGTRQCPFKSYYIADMDLDSSAVEVETLGTPHDTLCSGPHVVKWIDDEHQVVFLSFRKEGESARRPYMVRMRWDGTVQLIRKVPNFEREDFSGDAFPDGKGGLLVLADDGVLRAMHYDEELKPLWVSSKVVEYATLYLYGNPAALHTGHYSWYRQVYDHGLMAVTCTDKERAPFESGPQPMARVMAFDWELQPKWKEPVNLLGPGARLTGTYTGVTAAVRRTAPAKDGGIWILFEDSSSKACEERSDGWWNCGRKLYLQHVTADGKLSFP